MREKAHETGFGKPFPSARKQRVARTGSRIRAPHRIPVPEATKSATPSKARLAAHRLAFPALAFLVALQLPWVFSVGDLRLAPYRLVLIVMLPICFVQLLSGKAGRIRITDIALFLFCCWCTVSIIKIHGMNAAIQPGGMIFIETMGGYLLARCTVRSAEDFHQVAKTLFVATLMLLPFALHEALTGQKLLLNTLRLAMPTYIDVGMPARWGLDRVQGNNIHPIHFGVAIGSTLTLTHLVLGYKKPPVARNLRSFIVFLTAFLSLSSGPITSMVGQIALLSWNRMLHGFQLKWAMLLIGGLGIFVAVEIFANRSLPVIMIGYFAFDEWSAYIRTLTWEYGTQSILNHPLWGVGFGPWDKPSWLTPSIDMHWIIDSVRHGIPAGFFIFLAFFAALFAVGRSRLSDEKLSTYRMAYMITMAGFFMTGWAVYLWETSYALFTFLLGSGFWLVEAGAKVPFARKGRGGHGRQSKEVNLQSGGYSPASKRPGSVQPVPAQ